MKVDKELGEAVEKLRQENGVDEVELARRMKTSVDTAKRWIKWKYARCSLQKVQAIIEAIKYPRHTLPYLRKTK